MMANFYAFDNKFGVGSRDTDNERIGTVLVFTSRAARDEWVSKDNLRNGNYCREAITAMEARRDMARVAFDELWNRRIVSWRSDLKHASIDVIVRAYTQVMA